MGYAICLRCLAGDHGRCIDLACPPERRACGCFADDEPLHRGTAADAAAARIAQTATQPELLDRRVAAEQAVARLDSSDAAWLEHADRAFDQVARRQGRLTVNDVWSELERVNAPQPHDTRAMGAAVKRAIRRGAIHRRPIRDDTNPRLWASRRYAGG